MIAAIYFEPTGYILRVVECPEDALEMQCGENESYVLLSDIIDDSLFYIDGGELKEKQPHQYNISTSGLTATITGLAPGTLVNVGGQDVVADEEPTEISFDVPEVHELRLVGPTAYIDEIIEVTVNG